MYTILMNMAFQDIVSSCFLSSHVEEEIQNEIIFEEDNYYNNNDYIIGDGHGRDKGNADGNAYLMLPCIVHGPVTVEQKSSFQSHVAAVRSMEEVERFRSAILENKKAIIINVLTDICMYLRMHLRIYMLMIYI